MQRLIKQIRFFINSHPVVAFAAVVVAGLAVSTDSPLPHLLERAVVFHYQSDRTGGLFGPLFTFIAIVAIFSWNLLAAKRNSLPKDRADGNRPPSP